jgi:hypothetical protein
MDVVSSDRQMQDRQPPRQRSLYRRPDKLATRVVDDDEAEVRCRAKRLPALSDLMLRAVLLDIIDQFASRQKLIERQGADQLRGVDAKSGFLEPAVWQHDRFCRQRDSHEDRESVKQHENGDREFAPPPEEGRHHGQDKQRDP